jgi:hypothetical protein
MKKASTILAFSLVIPTAMAQAHSGASGGSGVSAGSSAAPVATPRTQPAAPVGPGSVNNPAVVTPPPTVGQTFQRSVIGGPPVSATPISPDASVPRTTIGNSPVVPSSLAGVGGVSGTTLSGAGGFSGTNLLGGGTTISNRSVGGFGIAGNPVQVPATTVGAEFGQPVQSEGVVTFDFPPGSTIIRNSGNATQPQGFVPGQALSPAANGRAVGNSGRIQTGSGSVNQVVPPVTQPVPSTRLRTLQPSTTTPTTVP